MSYHNNNNFNPQKLNKNKSKQQQPKKNSSLGVAFMSQINCSINLKKKREKQRSGVMTHFSLKVDHFSAMTTKLFLLFIHI